MPPSRPSRREFLELTTLALSAAGSTPMLARAAAGSRVALVVSSTDPIANAGPVQLAVAELRGLLTARGVDVTRVGALSEAPGGTLAVIVSASGAPGAAEVLARAGATLPTARESLAIVPRREGARPVLLACGPDVRGLMYAVLELADRVRHGDDPMRALEVTVPFAEQPFNSLRAIGRPLVSDVEDLSWYHDRAFWPAYFALLARERVNRFHLLFGMGYDTLRWVKDAYLLFAYPFLVKVPGQDVRAVGLGDDERDRNLESLRFISREAVAHGIDFQLGLWTHGYTWDDSPDANYTIAGLSPANHGAYCRDALSAVLSACPDITGVTLRTHYESGVKEGSYAFWKTIFDGVPKPGRRLEIELHAKGLDQRMIDGALSTGLPVRVSPKYWAEHVGLPYHQTAIRALELPKDDSSLDAFSALSFGERQHTRYGHADFLRDDRRFGVFYRVFPGTHKLLLWGDPLTAAQHARAFRFCGAEGAELFEPLSFKGRRGSGIAGGRCAYRDASLTPARAWEKYLYTYRLWGRMLYNPDTPPETWRRLLRTQYGSQAEAVELALGAATRILPLVTTAHLPSAAQDTYSPEFYTNQSIVDPAAPSPYGDTPVPKDFGHVSALDPQIFSTLDEHVGELLGDTRSGKYSPPEVARWLDALAGQTDAALARLGSTGPGGAQAAELRRAVIDIRAQAGMGRFFAAKLRAGALFLVHQKTGDREALGQAVRLYRQARDAWAQMAGELSKVYVPDITFGPLPHQRGHWSDRVAAMDADIVAMERMLAAAAAPADRAPRARAAVDEILQGRSRDRLDSVHAPPSNFVPGDALELALEVRWPSGLVPGNWRFPDVAAVLHYRHVNQAERYRKAEMTAREGTFHAAIPAGYTNTAFPLQYYFEVRVLENAPAKAAPREGVAWLYPGFNDTLTSQPYYVVRRRT
jgi:hypothetical protein